MNAIIFGITGQDGSYLSEYLLDIGYTVVGVNRRCSVSNTERLESILNNENFHLLEGDITDYASVSGVFSKADYIFNSRSNKYKQENFEVYNLAAQSHVGTSFIEPLVTWDIDAKSVLNILEVIKQDYLDRVSFYQASTSEMFGENHREDSDGNKIQDEHTPFNPRSPYAIAKVAAHEAVRLYRESYGLSGHCGILFNHESPRRGENFVTRKITKYVAKLYWAKKNGLPIEKLQLGNLSAKRDWGHAKDYVRAMHSIISDNRFFDYIVATGVSHSVEEFCTAAFSLIGCDYKEYVEIDQAYIRPSEVPHLQGNSCKIKNYLKWAPEISFEALVEEMVKSDIESYNTGTIPKKENS
jgi:GDPmannose 4,6-dehydratase